MTLPHIMTLIGATVVAYVTGVEYGAIPLTDSPDDLFNAFSGPVAQVTVALTLMLALLASVRLAGRKPGLDGPAVLTAAATVVWLAAGWRLNIPAGHWWSSPESTALLAVGGGLALVGTVVAYWGDRLRVVVRVSDERGRHWRHVMSQPGSWSAVTPEQESRPPAFHVSETGLIALGVRNEDAEHVTIGGRALPEQRWFGASDAPVRAAALLSGDSGVCRSGNSVTAFKVRGRYVRGGRDGWSVGTVATVLMIQVGLIGAAVDGMQGPQSVLPLATDAQPVLSDDTVPASLGRAPRLLEQTLEIASAAELWLDELPAAVRTRPYVQEKTRLQASLTNRRDLNSLLAASTQQSPVAQVLRRTPALEARMERMFDTSAVTSDTPRKLAFRSGSRAWVPLNTDMAEAIQRPNLALSPLRPSRKRRVGAEPKLLPPEPSKSGTACHGIQKQLLAHRERIAACAAAAVAKGAAGGSLRMLYRVAADGRVRFSPLFSDANQRAAVRSCLLARFRGVRVGARHAGCSGSMMLHGGSQ